MMAMSKTSTQWTRVSDNLESNRCNIDKLDMINNLNSIKLLAVSEAFEAYPDMRVDCD